MTPTNGPPAATVQHSRPAAGVTAAAGAAAAVTYGAIKANWAFGGTLGLRGAPPWETGEGGWAGAGGAVRFLAFEGTVVLAAAAVALLLALVSPWGRRLPRRPLAAAAWLGCAAVGGAWIGGTVGLLSGSAGPAVDPSLTPALFWTLWASFGVLGAAFGATAWLTR